MSMMNQMPHLETQRINEIIDMFKRDDYYLILKYKHHTDPEERIGIYWNYLRRKWAILKRFHLL